MRTELDDTIEDIMDQHRSTLCRPGSVFDEECLRNFAECMRESRIAKWTAWKKMCSFSQPFIDAGHCSWEDLLYLEPIEVLCVIRQVRKCLPMTDRLRDVRLPRLKHERIFFWPQVEKKEG